MIFSPIPSRRIVLNASSTVCSCRNSGKSLRVWSRMGSERWLVCGFIARLAANIACLGHAISTESGLQNHSAQTKPEGPWLFPLLGDHVSRSERPFSGCFLVAVPLAGHWVRVRAIVPQTANIACLGHAISTECGLHNHFTQAKPEGPWLFPLLGERVRVRAIVPQNGKPPMVVDSLLESRVLIRILRHLERLTPLRNYLCDL